MDEEFAIFSETEICFFRKHKRTFHFLRSATKQFNLTGKIRAIGYNQNLALRILNPNIVAFIYAMTILTERAVTW